MASGRLCDRGGARARLDLKQRIFAAARQDRDSGRDPRHQHLVAVGHRDLGRHQPANQGRGALLQPGPGDELVEVIKTVVTDPEVVADVEALARRLGKAPVVISDRAGFIANALLFGYLNHAVSMFESATRPARTSTPR